MNHVSGVLDTCVQSSSLAPVTTIEKGVTSCNKDSIHVCTPFEKVNHVEGGLADKTIASLVSFFDTHTQHRPSEEMILALTELASTMEAMANDVAIPHFYLSSLDPGVGKTQTIIHFIQELMASPSHMEVGVLICVSRLDEIAKLAQAMSLPKDDFGVFTSDKHVNSLGADDINQARVLFTTHQMVESRCDGGLFQEVDAFHFRRSPRMVRIWDEAILPGQPLTIERDALGSLLQPIRPFHPKLAEEIEDLFLTAKELNDGSMISIPNLEEQHGVDLNDAQGLLSDEHERVKQTASSLWLLSGKTATIRRDHAKGNTMLDYRDTLPKDLAPLVVLDASGRVRTTYAMWEEGRQNLVRLKAAPKRYDNLDIHVWSTGGGKGSFKKHGDALVDGVVATINSKPDEEWLVVHHKGTNTMDLPTQVLDLIGGDKARVHFTNWGNHHGTNAYAHVQNVILAGTLFYRPSTYEAMGRLSGGLSEGQRLSKGDFSRIMAGEHANLILQALCRASVRQCIGDVCAPCNAYIIASAKSGIKATLPNIFPGCRVRRWKPVQRPLKGKAQEARNYILKRIEEDPQALVTFKDVMTTIGWTDRRNFKKRIRQHEDFIEVLAEADIVEHGPKSYPTGFISEATIYGFINEENEDF